MNARDGDGQLLADGQGIFCKLSEIIERRGRLKARFVKLSVHSIHSRINSFNCFECCTALKIFIQSVSERLKRNVLFLAHMGHPP